ncbi:MAG: lipid-A-disaccharide synthase [Muribaculaceae bacterium]
MKYFIIAGEASGDLHASQLINAIISHDAEAQIKFFGGDMMAQASGAEPLVHYRDMAYMGFIEVAKHLGTIMGFLKTAKRTIDEFRPDALVLVDYPSFNLKVAKYAHEKGIKAFYFISPKVWAWKEYRVKQIKKYITAMYSILPFETQFYARYQYEVNYVGNPTVAEVGAARAAFGSREQFLQRNGLSSKPIIAIVPGSRRKEIRDNLPSMLRAVMRYGDCQVVIAGAPSMPQEVYDKVMSDAGVQGVAPVLRNQSFELVANARVALVTSGTATLETAVLGTPQVVCYRMNGSPLVYNLYKHLLKVKYVSLPNLIADEAVIPELLLHFCNEQSIASWLDRLLSDSAERTAMLQGYERMNQRLGTGDCAQAAALHLINSIKNQ